MKIHFVGIGGIGVSALADICLDRGFRVTGSDIGRNERVEALSARGALVFVPHDRTNLPDDTDLVVFSSAVRPDNPELKKAESAGIKIMRRGDFLPVLLDGKRCMATVGSHGKTTVASILAESLVKLEGSRNASYYLGGILNTTGKNGFYGSGEFAAVELDESDRSFLSFKSGIAGVTNIELEHVDTYGDMEGYARAYADFIRDFDGDLFIGAEAWPLVAKETGSRENIRTVGLGSGDLCPSEHGDNWFSYGGVRVDLPRNGKYFVFDAFLAFVMLLSAGFAPLETAAAVSGFRGTARRLETVLRQDGIALIDDYAHHPTEIRSTYKSLDPRRQNIVVFQPHRYSRFNAFFDEFKEVLKTTGDVLIILPVYAASETKKAGERDADEIYAALKNIRENVYFAEDLGKAASICLTLIDNNTNIITFGAGNVNRVLKMIEERVGS